MTEIENSQTGVNNQRTQAGSGTELTHDGSRTVLDQTRRDLIALRVKHGSDSPIGYRCSNIVELIQMPEVPAALVARQMGDLRRLLAAQ